MFIHLALGQSSEGMDTTLYLMDTEILPEAMDGWQGTYQTVPL